MNKIDEVIYQFSSVQDENGVHIYIKNPLLMNLRKFYQIDGIIHGGMPEETLRLIEDFTLNISREIVPRITRKISVFNLMMTKD